MEPITYHVKGSRLEWEGSLMLTFWMAGVIGLLILAVFGEMQVGLTLLIVCGLLLAISYIPRTVRVLRRSSKAENSLRLDDQGLTRLSWGRSHRWDWGELSAFEVRGVARFGFLTPDRYIPIVKLGEGAHLRSRLARRGFGGILRDEYDTPLEDIAVTLNQYRKRALGGGAATDGTQAPKPA